MNPLMQWLGMTQEAAFYALRYLGLFCALIGWLILGRARERGDGEGD